MSWKKVKLNTLLIQPVQNGYSPVCPDKPNGKWVLGLGALTNHGLDIAQAKPAPENDTRVDEFLLRPGDFLVSRSNTRDKVGRSALFKGQLQNCSYPDLMMRFRVDESKVVPEFLEVYLRGHEAIRYFQSSASGTSGSMVKINKRVVERLPVPLPPLPEQTAIADLLSTWDKAIEKTDSLIAAKEKQFHWARQNLLTGKVRLNGFLKKWKHYLLRDILHEHKQQSTGKEDVCSVSVHKGVVNQIEHLGRSFSAKNTNNYNLVMPGDIVYTKSPTGNFPYGVIKQSKLNKNVIVSPLYGVFTPEAREIGVILDAYFESPAFTRNYLNSLIQKGAKNTINITNETFLSRELNLPVDKTELARLADLVDTSKKEIQLLIEQTAMYRRQKRGLMQKLLTGKWRVKHAEVQA